MVKELHASLEPSNVSLIQDIEQTLDLDDAFTTKDKKTNRASDHIPGRTPVFWAAFHIAIQIVKSPKNTLSLFGCFHSPVLPLRWGLSSPGNLRIKEADQPSAEQHVRNTSFSDLGQNLLIPENVAEGLWEHSTAQDVSPELLYYTALQGFFLFFSSSFGLQTSVCCLSTVFSRILANDQQVRVRRRAMFFH